MFLREEPDDILPYDHRLDAKNPLRTALCFYQKDESLYRRLSMPKLETTAKELCKYMGFCGFDLSIFHDFLKPFQKFYVLANMVIDIFFCLNGARLIPNLRADEDGGVSYFPLFEHAPIVACGTLGCASRAKKKRRNVMEISKYAESHPNQVILQYGSGLCERGNARTYRNYGRWRRNG